MAFAFDPAPSADRRVPGSGQFADGCGKGISVVARAREPVAPRLRRFVARFPTGCLRIRRPAVGSGSLIYASLYQIHSARREKMLTVAGKPAAGGVFLAINQPSSVKLERRLVEPVTLQSGRHSLKRGEPVIAG